MSTPQTPASERVHIALLGRTNAGKSAMLNCLAKQDVAIVSNTPGTTTDPVQKPMELTGMGAVVIIDTPGLDDNTTLGKERMARTSKMLDRTDIAVVLFTDEGIDTEMRIIEECRTREIPVVVALNQVDRINDRAGLIARIKEATKCEVIATSTTTGEGIEALREAIINTRPAEERLITEGFCKAGDRVLLVMPQDKSAPKGRLIQPQVQTLRNLLDKHCIPLCCAPEELPQLLQSLVVPLQLIITDSQVFAQVEKLTPPGTRLTSFSVLMARHKGDIDAFLSGAKALLALPPTARVLIAEACSHIPQNEDIGRVKLPRLLRSKLGDGLVVDVVGGNDFPDVLTGYDIVIHCGACMFNRRAVMSRVRQAKAQGVPITNYGIAIAALSGILEKITV